MYTLTKASRQVSLIILLSMPLKKCNASGKMFDFEKNLFHLLVRQVNSCNTCNLLIDYHVASYNKRLHDKSMMKKDTFFFAKINSMTLLG